MSNSSDFHLENRLLLCIIDVVVVAVSLYLVVQVVIIIVITTVRTKQARSIARPLVRANDELAEELVAQAVKVLPVELRVGAFFKVILCHDC